MDFLAHLLENGLHSSSLAGGYLLSSNLNGCIFLLVGLLNLLSGFVHGLFDLLIVFILGLGDLLGLDLFLLLGFLGGLGLRLFTCSGCLSVRSIRLGFNLFRINGLGTLAGFGHLFLSFLIIKSRLNHGLDCFGRATCLSLQIRSSKSRPVIEEHGGVRVELTVCLGEIEFGFIEETDGIGVL